MYWSIGHYTHEQSLTTVQWTISIRAYRIGLWAQPIKFLLKHLPCQLHLFKQFLNPILFFLISEEYIFWQFFLNKQKNKKERKEKTWYKGTLLNINKFHNLLINSDSLCESWRTWTIKMCVNEGIGERGTVRYGKTNKMFLIRAWY